jgi:hypothetical protein
MIVFLVGCIAGNQTLGFFKFSQLRDQRLIVRHRDGDRHNESTSNREKRTDRMQSGAVNGVVLVVEWRPWQRRRALRRRQGVAPLRAEAYHILRCGPACGTIRPDGLKREGPGGGSRSGPSD